MRIVVLITALLGVLGVAAGQEPEWATCLVEVTGVDRQDPPAALLRKRDELDAERRTGLADGTLQRTEAGEPAEALALRERIDRLDARIERETGWVILGWAVRLDRRGERTDRSTRMIGIFLPANTPLAALLGDADPGLFLAMARLGSKEIFSAGGRRYFRARRLEPAERPEWWSAPPSRDRPEVDPANAGAMQITLHFDREQERDAGRRTYRYTMKMSMDSTPEDSTGLVVLMHLRYRTAGGASFGPIVDVARFERDGGKPFAMNRSFDVGTPRGIRLAPEATTVDVVGMAWMRDE